MIELKKGKNLWFGIAVIILTALLTLYNISSFKNGLIYDIDEPLVSYMYTEGLSVIFFSPFSMVTVGVRLTLRMATCISGNNLPCIYTFSELGKGVLVS